MFHATFDATYGAYLRMESHHIYEAMLYTPLEPQDIVVGEVMWGATRAIISATAVMIAALAFGLIQSPFALLAIPAAYLIGTVFASMAMTITATATTIGAMNKLLHPVSAADVLPERHLLPARALARRRSSR